MARIIIETARQDSSITDYRVTLFSYSQSHKGGQKYGNEFLKDLAKSDAEFEKTEDQYLCQIFADDEEINHVEALVIERSIKTFENCKTKEEFEAIVGEA